MAPYASEDGLLEESKEQEYSRNSRNIGSGGFEIEFVQDANGNFHDRIIISLPNQLPLIRAATPPRKRNSLTPDGRAVPTIPEHDDDDDVYSVVEDLTNTLDSWLGCNGCTAPALKSALRRKSDELAPPQIDRNVSFTNIDIKEFNMTLGNHPNSTSGPPVMLDTKPVQERTVDLEQYESARQPRRNRRQLKLSFEDRRGILEQERGYSVAEIKEAWLEALQIRKQRQETRMRSPTMTMIDEAWESACRKYQRIFDSLIDALSCLGLEELVTSTSETTKATDPALKLESMDTPPTLAMSSSTISTTPTTASV